MDPEYREGIYLGMSGYGVDQLVGTADGVETTRDLRRMSCDQWDADLVNSVMTTLEGYLDPEVDRAVPTPLEPSMPAGPREEQDVPYEVPQARRLRLYPRDIEAHGYSPQCPGCIALRRKRPAQRHSEACRTRIIAELEKTEEGRARIRAEEERKEQYVH